MEFFELEKARCRVEPMPKNECYCECEEGEGKGQAARQFLVSASERQNCRRTYKRDQCQQGDWRQKSHRTPLQRRKMTSRAKVAPSRRRYVCDLPFCRRESILPPRASVLHPSSKPGFTT